MTTQTHTHIWNHRKQPQSSHRLLFSTHHPAEILLPKISTSLEPSNDAIFGNSFESDDKIIDKQSSGCMYKIQTGTRREEMLLFLTGARLLKLMETM